MVGIKKLGIKIPSLWGYNFKGVEMWKSIAKGGGVPMYNFLGALPLRKSYTTIKRVKALQHLVKKWHIEH